MKIIVLKNVKMDYIQMNKIKYAKNVMNIVKPAMKVESQMMSIALHAI